MWIGVEVQVDPFATIVGLDGAPTPRRRHGVARGGSSAASNDNQIATVFVHGGRGVDEPVETSCERRVTNVVAGQCASPVIVNGGAEEIKDSSDEARGTPCHEATTTVEACRSETPAATVTTRL